MTPFNYGNYENSFVEPVNYEQATFGLPPLKSTIGLEDAARYHAPEMAQANYSYHDTYDRVDEQLFWICSTWERSRHLPLVHRERIKPSLQETLVTNNPCCGEQLSIGIGYPFHRIKV